MKVVPILQFKSICNSCQKSHNFGDGFNIPEDMEACFVCQTIFKRIDHIDHFFSLSHMEKFQTYVKPRQEKCILCEQFVNV